MGTPKGAHNVKDYETAAAFLGSKDDRPLGHNTRLRRLADDRIGVLYYYTYVVEYQANGNYVVRHAGWRTQMTKKRIENYSPVRIGPGFTIVHSTDPYSPPKLTKQGELYKCRTCSGKGGSHYTRNGEYRSCEPGDDCNYADALAGLSRWHPLDEPVQEWSDCWRCKGVGRVDYGSKPIHTEFGGPLLCDPTGKVIDPYIDEPYTNYGSGKGQKLSPGWPPVYKPKAVQQEQDILGTMREVVPALGDVAGPCPVCHDEGYLILSTVIIHLNDSHKWTREAIADWLESLDVDLEFKEKEVTEDGE